MLKRRNITPSLRLLHQEAPMPRNASKAAMTFCGIVSLLCSAGCIKHSTELGLAPLATLLNGDTIQVRLYVNGQLQMREVLYHRQGEHDQTVTLGTGGQYLAHVSPDGIDILQDGSRVIIWRIFGKDTKPLAFVDMDKARKGGRPLLEPAHDCPRKGKRLGCRVVRDLARVKVPDGGVIFLSMDSHRNAGFQGNDDKGDCLFLGYKRCRLFYSDEAIGTAVLNLCGDNCVVDPFTSCPSVEVRWECSRRAAWVVQHGTGRVLGGFQVEGHSFVRGDVLPADWMVGRDDVPVPEWATATGGQLIATTSGAAAETGNKKGGR